MNAIFAVLLLAAAIVLFSWVYNQVRKPNPKAWTDSDLVIQLIVFIWIVALCGSAGMLTKTIDALDVEPITPTQYASIAAIIVVTGAILYLLRLQWRRYSTASIAGSGQSGRDMSLRAANGTLPVTQDNSPNSRSPRAA